MQRIWIEHYSLLDYNQLMSIAKDKTIDFPQRKPLVEADLSAAVEVTLAKLQEMTDQGEFSQILVKLRKKALEEEEVGAKEENALHKKAKFEKGEQGDEEDKDLWLPATPLKAAQTVKQLLGLSDEQAQLVHQELEACDEDPVLIVQLNPAWKGVSGPVLNAIAQWSMVAPHRRDKPEFLNWMFHFSDALQVDNCRQAILAAFPGAFVPLGAVVAAQIAAGVAVNLQPLARTVIVHKVGVRQDDVQPYPFFGAF